MRISETIEQIGKLKAELLQRCNGYPKRMEWNSQECKEMIAILEELVREAAIAKTPLSGYASLVKVFEIVAAMFVLLDDTFRVHLDRYASRLNVDVHMTRSGGCERKF
jgi:hypothetical protein